MASAAVTAVFVLLGALQFSIGQKVSPTPHGTNEDARNGCERAPCPCAGGMPGIPGANGMPGMPGQSGARGEKGDSGQHGRPGPRGPQGGKGDRGSQGLDGNPGKTGPGGAKGSKGDRGGPGTKGDRGGPGTKGDRGGPGTKGDAGKKGNAAGAGPISAANWKQCVWKKEDDTDSGKLKECSFNKLQSHTALKVSFEGVLRVSGDAKCNRWYFKFSGNECSGPMTIEAMIYSNWSSGNPNLHHHRSFEGYCENLSRGAINVELWVGSCSGLAQGDAYTSYNSVSRIIVEEVAPPQ